MSDPVSFKAPAVKEIALEFRMAPARDEDTKDAIGWGMVMTGKYGDVRHDHYGPVSPIYPSGHQFNTFIRLATRHIRAWFDSEEYEEARDRAEKKRHGGLIVIPGRTG